jgi:hypothetical protein
MTLPCVMALGRTRLLFWVSFVYALVHVPAFIAGTALFGLAGSIGSIVLAGVLYSYLNTFLLKRSVGLSLLEIGVQLRRPLLATAVMAGAVWTVGAVTPLELFSESGSWWSLVTKIGIGGVVFCGVQVALWRIEGRPPGIEQRFLQVMSR